MQTRKTTIGWQRWVPYSLMLGDAVAFFAAFYFSRLSHAVYYGRNPFTVLATWWGSAAEINLLLFLLLAAIAITVFLVKGHYARRKVFWDEFGDILGVFTLLLAVNAGIAFSGKWPLSRLWLFSTWLLALLLVPLFRRGLRAVLIHLGLWSRPVALIGAGDNAREALRALHSDRALGLQVRWILLPDSEPMAEHLSFADGVPVQSLGADPLAGLAGLGNPQVVLALDQEQWYANERLLRTLSLHYPNLAIAPPLRGLPLFGLELMHFFSHEVLMLRVRDNLGRPGPRLIKRLFDLLTASLLLLVLAPVFLLLAWRIRAEDAGPVFFIQEREGRFGRPFPCLKFRSMVHDAEARLAKYLHENPAIAAEYQRNYKLRNDPRVTRIGRYLRRTSLDELPQLFNVLRGEMSLVGPRPLLAREVQRYGDTLGLYQKVRPGITGLWQVSGRSETTFHERANLDAWYVKNWSLWYDIVILLRTVKVVFGRDGAY
ncbi:undecaprenyl-phosphate galactose phosphotransferase WbaP [Acidithiobacillus sp. IBUN Pt1247-S3]|uniref:undecaprenyl-phosphate galactose phosphotransferase WbaP n=1 Tax=Acidithiobacillus sp. IBUN Pt1247-S3 TaxID=3166642 RepID=UPI0034E43140